jgi:hypothetical protein
LRAELTERLFLDGITGVVEIVRPLVGGDVGSGPATTFASPASVPAVDSADAVASAVNSVASVLVADDILRDCGAAVRAPDMPALSRTQVVYIFILIFLILHFRDNCPRAIRRSI